MSEQNPELDIESLSSEEFTTQSILRRLPNARLEIHVTAQADYDVLSPTNKPLAKRPMHISRFTRCPICKEKGGVKVILRTDTVTEENSEIYTPVSRSMDINGAEMKCTLCGWMGIREELNRRARIPRD